MRLVHSTLVFDRSVTAAGDNLYGIVARRLAAQPGTSPRAVGLVMRLVLRSALAFDRSVTETGDNRYGIVARRLAAQPGTPPRAVGLVLRTLHSSGRFRCNMR